MRRRRAEADICEYEAEKAEEDDRSQEGGVDDWREEESARPWWEWAAVVSYVVLAGGTMALLREWYPWLIVF